jgi:hypothetical protein
MRHAAMQAVTGAIAAAVFAVRSAIWSVIARTIAGLNYVDASARAGAVGGIRDRLMWRSHLAPLRFSGAFFALSSGGREPCVARQVCVTAWRRSEVVRTGASRVSPNSMRWRRRRGISCRSASADCGTGDASRSLKLAARRLAACRRRVDAWIVAGN